MTASSSTSQYALGSTDAEHEPPDPAGEISRPSDRTASPGRGHRRRSTGSGYWLWRGRYRDVSRPLGWQSGEVVGIERDSRSITRARPRVSKAGLLNVSFMECDVSQTQSGGPFDAVVGRLILQFVPDQVAVLHCLSKVVRPGGVLVFQEVSYAPLLALSAHLPLWSASVSVARETIQRSGANPEAGVALHRSFQEAGLPPPTMRMEMLLGNTPDFALWIYDLLCGLRPKIQQHQVSLDELGDFQALPVRLQSEVSQSKTVVPYVALVGAWSHKPLSEAS